MADGVNINALLDGVGRFKEVQRTTGVSTTDITGKLLQLVNQNPEASSDNTASGVNA